MALPVEQLTAVAFPMRFAARGVAMATDADVVRQAVDTLLSTEPGERVMLPTWGCRLSDLIFAPMDDNLRNLVHDRVRFALGKWEARVQLVDVTVVPDTPNHLLNVTVSYRIKSTGEVVSTSRVLTTGSF